MANGSHTMERAGEGGSWVCESQEPLGLGRGRPACDLEVQPPGEPVRPPRRARPVPQAVGSSESRQEASQRGERGAQPPQAVKATVSPSTEGPHGRAFREPWC